MTHTSNPSRVQLLMAGCAAILVFLMALAPSASAKQVSRTCGLLPGDGAYSYIKTRGVKCRHAGKIAFRVQKRFCARRNRCLLQGRVATTHIYQGKVRYRGWSCRVKLGWEFLSVRCRKGRKWLHRESAS